VVAYRKALTQSSRREERSFTEESVNRIADAGKYMCKVFLREIANDDGGFVVFGGVEGLDRDFLEVSFTLGRYRGAGGGCR
jgi:hypothetical protein